jgi:hypothetical protein
MSQQVTNPLEDVIRKLIKACVFYADEANWEAQSHRGMPIEDSEAVRQDGGGMARDALKLAIEQGVLRENGMVAPIGGATVAAYSSVYMAKRMAMLGERNSNAGILNLAADFMNDAINGLPQDGMNGGVRAKWEKARDEYKAQAEQVSMSDNSKKRT